VSQQFKFECVITFEDDGHEVDEDYLDLVALYYGDKHQEFTLTSVADSIEEI
jgi:hypothetical protein